jgi:biotin transport system substrate-specific component
MKTFHPAIAARLFPRESAGRNIAFVIFAAALTAACAQASIPVYPVPFTLQTMAVTLAGLTLGWRLAIWSQITYIAAGCANMPVFANGEFGIAKLFGPTGGYLVSFIVAAGLLGYVSERGFIRNALDLASALIAANFIILAIGTAWLAWYVPQGTAMNLGFYPFLTGALMKSLVVVAMLPAAKRIIKSR